MNCIASVLCLLCCEIESVCGSAAWACDALLSGASMIQWKPAGAPSAICWAA